jgi:hypothetical protein
MKDEKRRKIIMYGYKYGKMEGEMWVKWF